MAKPGVKLSIMSDHGKRRGTALARLRERMKYPLASLLALISSPAFAFSVHVGDTAVLRYSSDRHTETKTVTSVNENTGEFTYSWTEKDVSGDDGVGYIAPHRKIALQLNGLHRPESKKMLKLLLELLSELVIIHYKIHPKISPKSIMPMCLSM